MIAVIEVFLKEFALSFIQGTVIETVEEYKYLGTIIDYKLTWSANTLAKYSKVQQRLYFLRKLHSFNADATTLTLFYLTFIQSVVTFAIQCWGERGGGLSVQNRNMLDELFYINEQENDWI